MADTSENVATEAPASNLLQQIGLFAGPALALAIFLFFPKQAEAVDHAQRCTAALAIWMAVWWMTEAVAIEATALLPLVFLPLSGVYPSSPRVGDRVTVSFEKQKVPAKVIAIDKAKGDSDEGPTALVAPLLLKNMSAVEPVRVPQKAISVEHPLKRAAAPYADRSVYMYLGGFLIALAMERWNLHKRIALNMLGLVGTSPARIVFGMMFITAGISLWISNTATAVMMLPIGLSLVALGTPIHGQQRNQAKFNLGEQNFGICVMLAIAYGASIGGLGTLVGTPPNIFFKGFMADRGISIGFTSWMLFAIPVVVVYLGMAWWVLVKWLFPLGDVEISGGAEQVKTQLAALGRMKWGEICALCVFLLTAIAWTAREPLSSVESIRTTLPWLEKLDEATIGLVGGLILFLIPVDWQKGEFVLDWHACRGLPWGVLLIFGGGLSLAAAMEDSKLAEWIAAQVHSLSGLPLWLLIALVVVGVVLFSEMASNLATATALLPILFDVAVGLELDPLVLCVPAIVAASCGFMLPVATPPNAIVFGSGKIPMRQMLRAGLVLDLIAVVLIPIAVFIWGGYTLGIRF
ncbi:MAG: DASS family sodium-coupled anion symporter [Pirellulales bacterium]